MQGSRARFLGYLLLAILSAVVAVVFYRQAFPIANVPLQLTQAGAQRTMHAFAEKMGHSLEGYRSVVVFDESTDEKNFIDLRYGPRRLEEAARSGMALWQWEGRWFKPGQHEQIFFSANTSGAIVGYNHVIEEEAARPLLSAAEARQLAERFLKEHISHHPWAELRFIEESSDKKPARTDWSFTWERHDLRMDDAPYRLWVQIQGDAVGAYSEGLKVPQWWTRDFDKKRELNTLCSQVSGYAFGLIFLAAGILFIRAIQRGEVTARRSVAWGWIAFITVVALLGRINEFSTSLFSYKTTQDWGSYITESGLTIVWETLLVLLGFWLLFVMADTFLQKGLAMGPKREHPRLTLKHQLSSAALSEASTLKALGVGIVFAIFGVAFVSLFYVLGQRVGIWCPVQVDHSEVLSGWAPWITPFNIGLTASFGEEFLFRVIALVVIWQLTHRRWLAVLLSSAVWAFLHSDYPQMPGYIRGVELTIEGILWSVLFLRYGIVSTLTAHYLYNSWLASFILFQSGSWGNKAGALVASLWPVGLFIWGCLLRRKRALEEQRQILEGPAVAPPAASPVVEQSPPQNAASPSYSVPHFEPEPVSFSMAQMVGLLGAGALALAVMFIVPQVNAPFQSFGSVELSREEIAATADSILRERGFDPTLYRRTISFNSSWLSNSRYLREHGSLGEMAALFQKEWPEVYWRVRYFQILQQVELRVTLDKRGQLANWDHILPREAPGAKLEREEALARVHEIALRDHKLHLADEALVSEDFTQQEGRRDWSFTFERNDFQWGEAKLRTRFFLHGDELNGFYKWIKVPEAWEREQEKSGWGSLVVTEIHRWKGLVNGLGIFFLFGVMVRRRLIPWRQAFALGVIPLSLGVIGKLNKLPWFYSAYGTTTPLAYYWVTQLGGQMVLPLLTTTLGTVIRAGTALGLLRWGFGWTLRHTPLWPAERKERAQLWRQMLVVAASSAALLSLLRFFTGMLQRYLFPEKATSFLTPPLNFSLPWVEAVTRTVSHAFSTLVGLGFAAGLLALMWRRSPKLAVALVGAHYLLSAVDFSLRETLFTLFSSLSYFGLAAWLLVKVWRFNPILIFLTIVIHSLMRYILLFMKKGGAPYQPEALYLIIFYLVVVALGIVAHTRTRLPVDPPRNGGRAEKPEGTLQSSEALR